MIGQNFKMLHTAKFNKNEKKVIFFASMGGFLEFYDFAIFCFNAIYFAQKFFPVTRVSAFFNIFIIFAIGYLMKPLGIFIYQKYCYRISLKYVLNLSIFFMLIGFIIIATTPTYQTIGIYAGIILLISRVLFGISCGIEAQSIIKYVSINLDRSRRKFAINGVLLGTELGLLIGLLLNKILVYYLNDHYLESWGWKIPFLVGAVFSLMGLVLRSQINTVSTQRRYFHNVNIFTMFYRYRNSILAYSGTIGILGVLLTNGIIFMPIYLHKSLNLDYTLIGNIIFNGAIIGILCAIIVGYISRFINPILLLKICFISVIIASIISYRLFARGNYIDIAVYLLVIHYSVFANLITKVIEYNSFPSYLRLTNILIVTHIGFIFFGGINPLIITVILNFTNSIFLAPCIYIIIMAIIGFFSLNNLIKKSNKNYSHPS